MVLLRVPVLTEGVRVLAEDGVSQLGVLLARALVLHVVAVAAPSSFLLGADMDFKFLFVCFFFGLFFWCSFCGVCLLFYLFFFVLLVCLIAHRFAYKGTDLKQETHTI